MGRLSCGGVQPKLRKGLWSPEEDEKLYNHIIRHGVGCWSSVPKLAGLQRCGKSCRLRWINYLRPDLKRGNFTADEDDLIVSLHSLLGNKWSLIAARLPGRTDNEIKNYWNTHIRRKLLARGIDPVTHRPVAADATVSFHPPQLKPPRCPDLNLDLCISPPCRQDEDQELIKPVVVVKRELLQSGHGAGLCFGCSLGLQKGAAGCSCSDSHFLGPRVGMLDFRGLEMK